MDGWTERGREGGREGGGDGKGGTEIETRTRRGEEQSLNSQQAELCVMYKRRCTVKNGLYGETIDTEHILRRLNTPAKQQATLMHLYDSKPGARTTN